MSRTRNGTMLPATGDAAAAAPVVPRSRRRALSLGIGAAMAMPLAVLAQPMPAPPAVAASGPPVTHYRTASIEGVNLFYREACSADAPVILLLHGFPTSSHMFRNLIPTLADRYRVIAPDYPGIGQSDMPDHKAFA